MENKTVLNEQHLEVLRKIREYAPSAVIGGGAARDLYFNRPFRDVDIFIPVREVSGRGKNKFPGNIFFEEVIPELLRLRLGCEDTYEAQMDYFSTTIGHVYDCQMELGNFQFIGTKGSALETIGNSDFGLNCIYHDGNKLTPLPPFEESVKKKMITPNVPVPRLALASKFYTRMMELQKKYPDFTIPKEWIDKIEATKKLESMRSFEYIIERNIAPARRPRRRAPEPVIVGEEVAPAAGVMPFDNPPHVRVHRMPDAQPQGQHQLGAEEDRLRVEARPAEIEAILAELDRMPQIPDPDPAPEPANPVRQRRIRRGMFGR